MLTVSANTDAFLARLATVPGAVQTAVSAAARAYAPSQSKADVIQAQSSRTRTRRLQPDRQAALARLAKPDVNAAPDPAALKQAAVQSALTALGRT